MQSPTVRLKQKGMRFGAAKKGLVGSMNTKFSHCSLSPPGLIPSCVYLNTRTQVQHPQKSSIYCSSFKSKTRTELPFPKKKPLLWGKIQGWDEAVCVCVCVCVCCLVMSYSLRPHGLQPSRLLCLWNSPGKNTRMGCHSLLQGIFLTQGSNQGLLHCRQILYHLSYQRNNSDELPNSNMFFPCFRASRLNGWLSAYSP